MPANPDVRLALRRDVRDSFRWCGGCGGPPFTLSSAEVSSILQHAQEMLAYSESFPFEDLMYELEWLFETNAKGARCTCGPEPQPVPKTGFYVYRLWGPNGRLLYVGATRALSKRLRAHQRKWGDLIVETTWEVHPDAASMLAAERKAIQEELPALNIAGVDLPG